MPWCCVIQLRLLRVFKLAKTWKTMRVIMEVITKTLFSVINVTIVLAIALYVCAVMGYQLFGGTYNARSVSSLGYSTILLSHYCHFSRT